MTTSFISFTYICQFNNCNNQETENKIKEAIDSYSDFSSMYEVFKTKLEEKQTKKSSISTSTYEQTTRQLPNTSILHFISMNILILHTLFHIFF